ncbi:MAG: HupE/UreJ family protein [Luteimonas sp.]
MKLRLIIALVFAGLLLLCGPLAAHTLSVSHLDIKVAASDPTQMQVELDLALKDLALTLPLDANRDEAVTWGELTAVRGQLEDLVAANVAITTNAGACSLTPNGLATRKYDDGSYATLQLTAHCPSAGTLRVRYGLFFDRDPQHRALITLHQGNTVVTGIARADAQLVQMPRSGGNPFLDFLREGIHHILIGYDHLAFLISLLLPAALVRVGRAWRPAPGLRASLWHVLGIVTAFTVAHSITLSLAALGWVTPASRWVEAAIAASVLLAALNNLWPVVTRRVWTVSFGFGLIHGFGFAGALSELGLPKGARLASLFGFNLGVEIGQLAVVALLLPGLYLLRHRAWYPKWMMPAASLLIAALASWWLFKRLAG